MMINADEVGTASAPLIAHLLLRDRLRQLMLEGSHPALGARTLLVAHIHLWERGFRFQLSANDDSSESRRFQDRQEQDVKEGA